MSAPIHQNFPALHNSLDSMNSLESALQQKQEELDNELNIWASFWAGSAHEAAMAWSRNISAQLEHSIQASVNYTATARQAVADMQAQEMTNAGLWT